MSMTTGYNFDPNLFVQQDEKILNTNERYNGYFPNLDVAEVDFQSLRQFYASNNYENQFLIEDQQYRGAMNQRSYEEAKFHEDMDVDHTNYGSFLIPSSSSSLPSSSSPEQVIESQIPIREKSITDNDLTIDDELVNFLDTVFENGTVHLLLNSNNVAMQQQLQQQQQFMATSTITTTSSHSNHDMMMDTIDSISNDHYDSMSDSGGGGGYGSGDHHSVSNSSLGGSVITSPSLHRVQQASYLQVLEPRCPTGYELYMNPPVLASTDELINYPNESSRSFNMGNLDRIRKLVSTYFVDNCMVKVVKPNFTEERVGNKNVVMLLGAILESFPDAVITIKSVKYCRSKAGARLLKVKYTFSGTQISTAPIEEYVGNKYTPVKESITNDMDTTELSLEQLEAFHRRELALKAEGKLICIESNVVLKMYIDSFSGKIGIYEAFCSAASFKAVN